MKLSRRGLLGGLAALLGVPFVPDVAVPKGPLPTVNRKYRSTTTLVYGVVAIENCFTFSFEQRCEMDDNGDTANRFKIHVNGLVRKAGGRDTIRANLTQENRQLRLFIDHDVEILSATDCQPRCTGVNGIKGGDFCRVGLIVEGTVREPERLELWFYPEGDCVAFAKLLECAEQRNGKRQIVLVPIRCKACLMVEVIDDISAIDDRTRQLLAKGYYV